MNVNIKNVGPVKPDIKVGDVIWFTDEPKTVQNLRFIANTKLGFEPGVAALRLDNGMPVTSYNSIEKLNEYYKENFDYVILKITDIQLEVR